MTRAEREELAKVVRLLEDKTAAMLTAPTLTTADLDLLACFGIARGLVGAARVLVVHREVRTDAAA